jgi:hypothetical protein
MLSPSYRIFVLAWRRFGVVFSFARRKANPCEGSGKRNPQYVYSWYEAFLGARMLSPRAYGNVNSSHLMDIRSWRGWKNVGGVSTGERVSRAGERWRAAVGSRNLPIMDPVYRRSLDIFSINVATGMLWRSVPGGRWAFHLRQRRAVRWCDLSAAAAVTAERYCGCSGAGGGRSSPIATAKQTG